MKRSLRGSSWLRTELPECSTNAALQRRLDRHIAGAPKPIVIVLNRESFQVPVLRDGVSVHVSRITGSHGVFLIVRDAVLFRQKCQDRIILRRRVRTIVAQAQCSCVTRPVPTIRVA